VFLREKLIFKEKFTLLFENIKKRPTIFSDGQLRKPQKNRMVEKVTKQYVSWLIMDCFVTKGSSQ